MNTCVVVLLGFVRVADLEQDEEGSGQLKSLLVDLVYSVRPLFGCHKGVRVQ
jgi:hypothetical protein